MAHQTQTFSPTPTGSTFTIPSQYVSEHSYYPRGRITFKGTGTVTLKAALDTKQVRITFTLPRNFGYALQDFAWSCEFATAADADNYNDIGHGGVQFTDPGGGNDYSYVVKSEGRTGASTGTNASKIYLLHNTFCQPWPAETTGSNLHVSIFDEDAVNATAAYTIAFFASFLQYDIRQLDNVVVNAPMPVRMC